MKGHPVSQNGSRLSSGTWEPVDRLWSRPTSSERRELCCELWRPSALESAPAGVIVQNHRSRVVDWSPSSLPQPAHALSSNTLCLPSLATNGWELNNVASSYYSTKFKLFNNTEINTKSLRFRIDNLRDIKYSQNVKHILEAFLYLILFITILIKTIAKILL